MVHFTYWTKNSSAVLCLWITVLCLFLTLHSRVGGLNMLLPLPSDPCAPLPSPSCVRTHFLHTARQLYITGLSLISCPRWPGETEGGQDRLSKIVEGCIKKTCQMLKSELCSGYLRESSFCSSLLCLSTRFPVSFDQSCWPTAIPSNRLFSWPWCQKGKRSAQKQTSFPASHIHSHTNIKHMPGNTLCL